MALNIKIIKLITGEDIVAEVLSENDNEVIIKNPVRLLIIPNKAEPKFPTVGFGPFMEFSTVQEFTFKRDHVILMTTPVSDFVNQYNTIFGGIVVPNRNLIVP